MSELRGSDVALVREQLGREPVTGFTVVARCQEGHPLVIRNDPVDAEGRPFPTLFWLTCPDAVKAVSRLEADGWIKRLDVGAAGDPAFANALRLAHAEYAEERARWAHGARASGGVGGSRAGIKCLHAHYANHLAGGDDPVGRWVAKRVDPVHVGNGSRPVAAVDMGTNSIRLLVATAREQESRELARDMVITRLGQGVDAAGRLHPDAIARTTAVLERYARRARALGADRIRVAATSAVRDAANRDELEGEVARLAGSPLEILSGEREAQLTFLGATTALEASPPFLVFDIGGGSTELVRGTDASESAISLDLGSVRLTERVRPADPPGSGDLESMRRIAGEMLAQGSAAMPARSGDALVGVAGTTTTVQALALGLDRYDPEAIHGTVLPRRTAEEVMGRLASMTTAQRRALPVMAPGREDVIVAGCVILLEIMGRWGHDSCLVSEHDILDGLVLEMVSPRAGR